MSTNTIIVIAATTTEYSLVLDNGYNLVSYDPSYPTLVVDGYPPQLGDWLLFKNQATYPFQNGVWYVTRLANPATQTNWQLSRFEEAANLYQNLLVTVVGGSTLLGYTYRLTTANPITPGFTPLTFAVQPIRATEMFSGYNAGIMHSDGVRKVLNNADDPWFKGDIISENGTIVVHSGKNQADSNVATGSLNLSSKNNQILLGNSTKIIIDAKTPALNRIYTLADMGKNASFVMSAGNQTMEGQLTLAERLISNKGVMLPNTHSITHTGKLTETAKSGCEEVVFNGKCGEVTFEKISIDRGETKSFLINNSYAGSVGIVNIAADTEINLQTKKVVWTKSKDIYIVVANNTGQDGFLDEIKIAFMSFN